MVPDNERTQEHARFLREKMADRGLKAPALSRLIHLEGERMGDDYVRKLARGYSELATVSLPLREALRKALRVSAEDWERETGLATTGGIDPVSRLPLGVLGGIGLV